MISGPSPIFEVKPLIVIHYGEESLVVDLMASEDDLIEDIFKRFISNKEDSNSNYTNKKSDSNDVLSSRSESEIYNINSN